MVNVLVVFLMFAAVSLFGGTLGDLPEAAKAELEKMREQVQNVE